jgi:predicted lipase
LRGFSYSQDLENWIENLSASHTIPYPHLHNASVHSGFYGAYRSLQDQIFPVLREQLQLYPDAELALTGHSLGGALATVALPQIVFELNVSLPKNISLYTFGSPRVGDVVRETLLLLFFFCCRLNLSPRDGLISVTRWLIRASA